MSTVAGGRCTHTIPYINKVADMETGLQHLIARGPSILYANFRVTRFDLEMSVWTNLGKDMFLWVPQRPQSPECYYYYRPHNLPLSSPKHQIIVASDKYD